MGKILGREQPLKLHDIEAQLSPAFGKGTKDKQGLMAIGQRLINLKDMACAKMSRIISLFTKCEWINSRSVCKKLDRDIHNLSEKINKTNILEDNELETITENLSEIRKILDVLKTTGATGKKRVAIYNIYDRFEELKDSVARKQTASEVAREAALRPFFENVKTGHKEYKGPQPMLEASSDSVEIPQSVSTLPQPPVEKRKPKVRIKRFDQHAAFEGTQKEAARKLASKNERTQQAIEAGEAANKLYLQKKAEEEQIIPTITRPVPTTNPSETTFEAEVPSSIEEVQSLPISEKPIETIAHRPITSQVEEAVADPEQEKPHPIGEIQQEGPQVAIETEIWPDGSKYEGQFKDDLMHGQGTYTWPSGAQYIGEFENGLRNGQGTYTMSDGSQYIGQFKDDVMHGKGTHTWPDGSKYEGDFKNGKKHGQGIYTWHSGSQYAGEFENGKRNGWGICTEFDGSKYEGQFKNDKANGKGTYIQSDGSKYEGEFKDDLKYGQGILTSYDGSKYVEKYKDGDIIYTERAEKHYSLESLKELINAIRKDEITKPILKKYFKENPRKAEEFAELKGRLFGKTPLNDKEFKKFVRQIIDILKRPMIINAANEYPVPFSFLPDRRTKSVFDNRKYLAALIGKLEESLKKI